MLTHRNMLFRAHEAVARTRAQRDSYSVVCYLPLCHVAERSFSRDAACHRLRGRFAESIDTVVTICARSRRRASSACRASGRRCSRASCIRSRTPRGSSERSFEMLVHYRQAHRPAPRRQWRQARHARRPAGLYAALARLFPRPAALPRPQPRALRLLRRRYGVARKCCMFFWILGCRVYQIYGMTESAGVCHMQQPGVTRSGCSGLLIPGLAAAHRRRRRTPDCGGPSVFKGYSSTTRRPTAPSIRAGCIPATSSNTRDDGEIRVVDRKKDI